MAIVPRQMAVMVSPHARFLRGDRALAALEPVGLARRERAMVHAVLDAAVLVRLAAVDPMGERGTGDQAREQARGDELHGHDTFSSGNDAVLTSSFTGC